MNESSVCSVCSVLSFYGIMSSRIHTYIYTHIEMERGEKLLGEEDAANADAFLMGLLQPCVCEPPSSSSSASR